MKLFKALIPLFILAASLSYAQDIKDMPSIAYVYPAGAKAGDTTEIIIGGKKFENISRIKISGEGITATIIDSIVPPEKNRATSLRNKLQGLLINKGLINAKDIENSALAKKIDYSKYPELQKIREQINYELKLSKLMESTQAAFAHTIRAKLEIANDAKLGKRTITLIGKNGVSNSIPFYIDKLPEYSERSIRARSYAIIFGEERGLFSASILKSPQAKMYARQSPNIQDVTLPTIINGQVDLLETDIYRFQAKKGQEIVAFVRARDLIYYIGDGVPGWFQAAISIKDSKGKEIAYVDDFYQNPDPLLAFTAPQTDEYTLEIKDAIYRGREDFVYRIILGEIPFITRTYPLGGNPSESTELDIQGFNLNRNKASIEQKLKPAYNELLLAKDNEKQAKLLYQLSHLKNIDFSKIDNTSKEKSASISPYSSINSILKKSGDKHFYKIKTARDKRFIFEVFARRLGSPIDTYLEIYDSNMQLLAHNDDFEDLSDGLNTHHADSKIDFTTKAKEVYYIVLRDTQNKAGLEYAYRLNIYEPKVDFEVKTSPSTINVIQGKSTPFNISIFRKNEGKFPIKIRLKNAPKGVSISGEEIPENLDNAMLVLRCDKDLSLGMHNIELEAVAKEDGKEIIKNLIPCEDMLQAFYYPHLVPTDKHRVYVISANTKKEYKDTSNINPIEARSLVIPDEIDIALGGEKQLNIGVYGKQEKKSTKEFPIHAELRDSSQGITIENIHNDKYGCTITLKSNEEICKVGQSANLIIDVYLIKDKGKKLKIDTLKAIKYIITEENSAKK